MPIFAITRTETSCLKLSEEARASRVCLNDKQAKECGDTVGVDVNLENDVVK